MNAPGAASLLRPQLSVVVPTLNERGNVSELASRLEQVLSGLEWELIFIDDDSSDGTAETLDDLASRQSRVRVLHRVGRRGLSGAVIEGLLSARATVVAVMDADLQHDETILPAMLARMNEGHDLVIGSRYCDGGSTSGWGRRRQTMSRLGVALSRLILKQPLSDPMSGYFMIRRDSFTRLHRRLAGGGYKILLDILASATGPLRFVEVPYTFRSRHAGESKLDSAVMIEFLRLLIDKRLGRYVSARAVLFGLVGLSGVAVHMTTLALTHRGLNLDFVVAQSIATLLAMTSNYALNNSLTYRDRRLHGTGWWYGLLSFYLVCGLGAVANVGVGQWVFATQQGWGLAGAAGIVVGVCWNYLASAAFTWRARDTGHHPG